MKKLLLLCISTLGFTALLQAQTDAINIIPSGNVGIAITTPVSSLEVAGSYGQKVTTLAANITLDATHNTVVCNPSGGSFIVTLPAAAGCTGRVYIIKRNATVTANTVTIAGGATVDGAATFILSSPNQAIEVFSDGSEWKSRVGGLSGLALLTAGNDIDFGTSSAPNSIDIEPILNAVHTISAPVTQNLNLNAASGFAAVVNNNNGTTGATQTFRIGNGAGGADVFYVYADGQAYTTNWWRSVGNTGWYSQSWGGGIFMDQADYVRVYNGKGFTVPGNVGIGNTTPTYNLDITGNTRTTGKYTGHLNVDDTRAANTAPTGYNNEVAFDFKQFSVLNSAPGSGTYGGLITMAPWGDNSGDASHQLLFNEGGIYWRQGQPDAAAWDAWSQVLTTSAGGAGTTNYLARWTSANSLGIGVTYDNGTSVGIGTATPGAKLHIADAYPFVAGTDGMLKIKSVTGNCCGTEAVSLQTSIDSRTDDYTISGYGGDIRHALALQPQGGYVGIGTTNPTARLHISAGDASYALFGPNTTWSSYLYVGAGTSIISANRAQVISTNGNLHLDAGVGQNIYIANYNGSNTFMQTGGGSVGIGTTTPGYKLHVPSGYIGTDYINTTDNSVGSGVTGVMIKQGDNFLRTGTAAAVATFLNGTTTGPWIPNNGNGDWQIASSSTSTGYGGATLELRESNFTNNGSATPPHLGFHWGGVIASNISIESNGRIAIRDNPGTGYENFIARDIYATGGLFYGSSNSRTQTRNNAGLRGDAGAQSGFYENDGTTVTNYYSGASGWQHMIDVRHNNPANNYAMQIAGSFFDQNFYVRKTNDNAAQSWARMVTSRDVAYTNNRGTYAQDATNGGYRVTGPVSTNLDVKTGDVIAIYHTSKFRWTGGSGGDHPFYGVRISGSCGAINVTDAERIGTADDLPRGQWQVIATNYVWVATCNGTIQVQLLVDNNADADDNSEYRDIMITAHRY